MHILALESHQQLLRALAVSLAEASAAHKPSQLLRLSLTCVVGTVLDVRCARQWLPRASTLHLYRIQSSVTLPLTPGTLVTLTGLIAQDGKEQVVGHQTFCQPKAYAAAQTASPLTMRYVFWCLGDTACQ